MICFITRAKWLRSRKPVSRIASAAIWTMLGGAGGVLALALGGLSVVPNRWGMMAVLFIASAAWLTTLSSHRAAAGGPFHHVRRLSLRQLTPPQSERDAGSGICHPLEIRFLPPALTL